MVHGRANDDQSFRRHRKRIKDYHRTVVRMLAAGYKAKEIGARLGFATKTVNNYLGTTQPASDNARRRRLGLVLTALRSGEVALNEIGVLRVPRGGPRAQGNIDRPLSKQELTCLQDLADGLDRPNIVARRGCTPKAVHDSIDLAIEKLVVANEVAAVVLALQRRLIELR